MDQQVGRRRSTLGMGKEIPSSEGVFPPSRGKEAVEDVTPELEDQINVVNYKSFIDYAEDVAIEVERLVEANFAKVINKQRAVEKFGEGTVSRIALLVKQKEDLTVKRRIIVDMRRSGGNDRATCPERIILPRIQDVTKMGQDMARRCTEVEEATRNYRENQRDKDPVVAQLIAFDLKDAFCHFGLCKEELKQSLAPLDDENFVLFSAMLFGFRSAPLIMGRLSAAIGRLWQAMMEPYEAQLQVYIDDILMMARGTEKEIHSLIAMGLYTLKAFGVNFALNKGERGVIPRMRWAVTVMYAVLADAERDEKEGKEERRAEKRDDKRRKKGLVAVKRLGATRSWLMKMFSYQDAFMLRTVKLREDEPSWALITDACPTGYGGILAAILPGQKEMTLVEAFAAKFTPGEAELLMLDYGESLSQGPLEALAVMRAVKIWSARMFERSILIRSDSVVALGMTKKLASPAPIINFLGGELAMELELRRVQRVVTQHIPGKLNDLADWLSRHDVRKDEIPRDLRGVTIAQKEALTAKDFFLPPPGHGGEDWSNSNHHSVAVFHNLG